MDDELKNKDGVYPEGADKGLPAAENPEGWCVEGAIEAMLFVTDGPISATVFAEMLEIGVSEVDEALRSLQSRLSSGASGIALREVAGGWRLFTDPLYHDLIERYVISWDTRKLSQAALETLAIVAYMQPVTRNDVAAVRGVNSDSSINSLVEKGLIREEGVAEAPGNPVLYGTSTTFLEKFGLRSTADLPPIEDFAPDEETRRMISERLAASSSVPEITEEQVQEALSQFAGAVEKIDFSKLQFDFDEE